MSSTPSSPERRDEVEDLAQAIREAIDDEISELAANLASTDDAHIFGDNEFKIRALAHRIAAKAIQQRLAQKKNGYRGSSVTCPYCGQAAEFHSHRAHTSFSLVGTVRYDRAYYLCRRCGKGHFPFDHEAGLTTRDLTPALERVTTLAGGLPTALRRGPNCSMKWPASGSRNPPSNEPPKTPVSDWLMPSGRCDPRAQGRLAVA